MCVVAKSVRLQWVKRHFMKFCKCRYRCRISNAETWLQADCLSPLNAIPYISFNIWTKAFWHVNQMYMYAEQSIPVWRAQFIGGSDKYMFISYCSIWLSPLCLRGQGVYSGDALPELEVPWYIGLNPWLWIKGLLVRFPSMPGTNFAPQQDTLSTLLLSTQVYKYM